MSPPKRTLSTRKTSPVVDPLFSAAVDGEYDHPAVGAPTKGPNRFTIHVPFDKTDLSLGKGSKSINDDGLTGKTDKHIHFEVRDKNKAIVVMGGPSKDAIEPGMFDVPKQSLGYSMVAEDYAWQESKNNHVIMSTAGDLMQRAVAAGRQAVLQADAGSAEVNALHAVTVRGGQAVFISSSAYKPELQKYQGNWTAASHDLSIKLDTKFATKAVDAAMAAAAVVVKLNDTWKDPIRNGSGFIAKPVWNWVKNAADVAKLVLTVQRTLDYDVAGQVKISADSDASISGQRQVSIFGLQSASVASALSANVYGLTAGVKGFLYASLFGGLDVSVRSFKWASLAADRGETKVSS